MTSGAQVSPLDTGCHSGSLGSASFVGSHVTRSSERVTWMFHVRLPVAYAYQAPSASRMNGSAKLASMTGFAKVPAAGLDSAAVGLGEAADPDGAAPDDDGPAGELTPAEGDVVPPASPAQAATASATARSASRRRRIPFTPPPRSRRHRRALAGSRA